MLVIENLSSFSSSISFVMSLPVLLSIFYGVSFARHDAYVTANGADNNICTESEPCGLFQWVIRNIESGYISDEDLFIHINGSDASNSDKSYCNVRLTGNITFILDTNTINTSYDWFGASLLKICESINFWPAPLEALSLHQGAHVTFRHLIWNSPYQLLEGNQSSTFECYICRIQHITANDTNYDSALFHLAGEVQFTDSIFENLADITIFELSPIAYTRGGIRAIQYEMDADSLLTFTHCTMSEIHDSVFIDVTASNEFEKTVIISNR